MGYQNLEVTTLGDKLRRGIAFNAEIFRFEDESAVLFASEDLPQILKMASDSEKVIKDLRVISKVARDSPKSLMKEIHPGFFSAAGPAAGAPIEMTEENSVFKRFSAFENDRRVFGGKLSPGSYATTDEDARVVKTGQEAVARYALPNLSPAIYVFTVKPIEDTRIQRGIVQPDFGQPGGGIEVLFRDGTTPNTVTGPDVIPRG